MHSSHFIGGGVGTVGPVWALQCDIFTDRSGAVLLLCFFCASFVDHLCFFCLEFVMPFVCVCLFVPCGHLLGKG